MYWQYNFAPVSVSQVAQNSAAHETEELRQQSHPVWHLSLYRNIYFMCCYVFKTIHWKRKDNPRADVTVGPFYLDMWLLEMNTFLSFFLFSNPHRFLSFQRWKYFQMISSDVGIVLFVPISHPVTLRWSDEVCLSPFQMNSRDNVTVCFSFQMKQHKSVVIR